MEKEVTRRRFIASAGRAALGAGAAAVAAPAIGRPLGSANDRINLALIGCGGQGRHDMNSLMGLPEVEVLAVCDVDGRHSAEAARQVEKKYGTQPRSFADFRRVLEMKEIDGVIIGTPDHWHALPMIGACEAGKDVYVEKPLSHDIAESRAMVNAAKKFGRVVQVGTQQRSDQQFADAIEYVRAGKLGKISVCRAWIVTNQPGPGKGKPSDPPKELDWDFWTGPAALEPYQENKCHGNWRWFFNTGGGWATDWGVHMIDIVLLGMRVGQPLEVSSCGGKIATDDDATTPDTMVSILMYPGFVMTWEIRQGNGRGLDGGANHGSEFIGTEGTLIVDRGRYQIFPEGGRKLETPPRVDLGGKYHFADFLDCMKSRKKPRSDIESMHDTTVTCHLTNLSYLAGRSIRWDPAREVVVGDAAVMALGSYRREYRAPWKLPRYEA